MSPYPSNSNHGRPQGFDEPDTPLLAPSPDYFSLPPMFDRRTNQSSTAKHVPDVRARRLSLLWTYAPDWILTIVIVGLFYLLDKIHGNWREFSLEDTSIQHTFATHERVPNWALFIIALVAPLVLMPLVNVITIRSWWDWHNSWLGLILGLALTGSLTQVVKVTVGRPRPDLIDRCQPIAGAHNAPVFGLVTAAICTQTDMAILKDGFRSFFSGHSSLSFAGLGYLSWYLAGKLHLFDKKGHVGKAWLAFCPLVGALMVAITRTMDNRHHWHDVTIGSIVGIVLSYFSYRQYYPPLHSEYSHLPYSPRIGSSSPSSSVPLSPTRVSLNQASNAPRVSPYRGGDLEAGCRGAEDHDEQVEMDGTVNRGGAPLEQIWRGGEQPNPSGGR